MQEPVLRPVLASLFLFASFVTTGYAAQFNDAFIMDGDSIFAIEADPDNEVFYAQVDAGQPVYNPQPRNNHDVFLNGGQGALVGSSWVLTSSHVVSWDQQKTPGKILARFAGDNGVEYRGERVFRHPYKNLALVMLRTPILQGREPLLLMMDVLRKGHGEIGIKTVSGKQQLHDVPVRSGNMQNLIIDEGQHNVRAGSSWVIESPLVGNVLAGVADGSGKAPQVAYVRKWMQQIVDANTPDETLYWASFGQALPDHINSQPQEMPGQVEELSEKKPSLIILP